VGRRRFRIQSAFEQDGYRVAVPEWFRDEPPAEGSTDAAELPSLATEVLELTANLTDSLRSAPVPPPPQRGPLLLVSTGRRVCVPFLCGDGSMGTVHASWA